jgi:hypothetical protein
VIQAAQRAVPVVLAAPAVPAVPAVMMDSMSDRRQPEPPAAVVDPKAVLPRTTRDETAEEWGESADPRDSDDERYLRERPPHHEA